jgi:hypothetical protein
VAPLELERDYYLYLLPEGSHDWGNARNGREAAAYAIGFLHSKSDLAIHLHVEIREAWLAGFCSSCVDSGLATQISRSHVQRFPDSRWVEITQRKADIVPDFQETT